MGQNSRFKQHFKGSYSNKRQDFWEATKPTVDTVGYNLWSIQYLYCVISEPVRRLGDIENI